MTDHHDPTIWTWLIDHVIGFGVGVLFAAGSAWRYLERQFEALRDHDRRTDSKIAAHDAQLAKSSAHHETIASTLEAVEARQQHIGDLVQRIAGKLGVD